MLHWSKFNLVGMVGLALQTSVLFVFTHVTPPIGYLTATATAVEIAVLNNFVWHQRWTWRDRPTSTRKQTVRRLLKFNLTSGLFSLIGNLVFMSIFVGRLGMPVGPANLASVTACSIVSFVLADRIAFR